MHLVGFTIEIYHDARSHQRQKRTELTTRPRDLHINTVLIQACGVLHVTTKYKTKIHRTFYNVCDRVMKGFISL